MEINPFSFAFYFPVSQDIDTKAEACKRFFDLATLVSNISNVDFNSCSILGEGYPDKIVKIDQTLALAGSKSYRNIDTILVQHYKSNKKVLSLNFQNIRNIGHIMVSANNSLILEEMNSRFVNRIIQDFCATYGYFYTNEKDQDPELYCLGIEVSSSPFDILFSKRQKLRSLWNLNKSKITQGYIRDVFVQNFLNTQQLSIRIESKDLKTFIIEKRLGELTWLNKELARWILNESEVEKAKKFLYESRFIISNPTRRAYPDDLIIPM